VNQGKVLAQPFANVIGARLQARRTDTFQRSHVVGEINDATIIAALRRQMTVVAARQVVAASNLANVNTPGYRAKEVSFGDALDQRLSDASEIKATNARHLGGTVMHDPSVNDAADLPSRRDGNNVQIDRELLTMTRAAGDFSAAQTALAAKFRLVRYALSESR
jgi:flagellar basal-body rod protein FlgB